MTCIIVGGVLFVISCIPTAADHARVTALLRDVESSYAFTTMRKDGKGPAIYVTGLAYSDHLDVYGI
jgi:hypothetical protein